MIPRFLFRGWNTASGGNHRLNTTSAVTPHAFYGSDKEPHDKSIFQMPTAQIKSEVQMHLEGRRGKSHFSSWAANLQTALNFAGPGNDAYVAVFDTSLRGKHNEIYHVHALREMGLTAYVIPEEYLVYGPVTGEAYTCVSVKQLRNQGMHITDGARSGRPEVLRAPPEVTKNDLAHASKIANMFRPISHAMGPDLFLTVFAAELSRLFRTDRGYNPGSGWSQKDNKAILVHLSDAVDLASKLSPKQSLVNPKTYVHGFSQLKAMVDILMTVGLGIDRKRSEMSKKSSSTSRVSPASGQKRKADDSQVSTDSKVVEFALQKALPRDLLEDLARHGSTFQGRLQATRKQLDSNTDGLGAKAQALKDKLVHTERRLKALSIDPKRNALSTSILFDLDELTKQAQTFTTRLQHAEASLAVLQKSCNENIESIGKEGDPSVLRGPQKPRHESPPPRPSVPLQPKAVAEQSEGFQGREKRVKKKIPST
ncbi:hypothetical protein INS49_001825 [Diaporthe citri]|uniref:uncharacterized protein n=1 Tax=Diaporthe citri TaxID=83186 RepID=UPI001C80588A|nr:uncharacterized protein INS49_001825 [Diaporthe citri]KAG6367632.1 hypothetical protein INS49_001825 [Diaporthe citri]